MTRKTLVIVASSAAALLALACASPQTPADGKKSPAPAASTSAPAQSKAPAPWLEGKFALTVKETIDAAEAAKDCAALQKQFDNASANDAATRNRTGSGTADLMAYIDAALKRAGCY